MQKTKQRRGRPSTKAVIHPLQAQKMSGFVQLLIRSGIVRSQQHLADILGVDNGTISNWVNGQTPISELVKYTLAHLYDVPESWWDQPDVPLASVIGKGMGTDADSLSDGPPIVPSIPVPFIEEGKLHANPRSGYELQIDNITLSYARRLWVAREHIRHPQHEYCLIAIAGDSMEPRYCDGDIVLVNLHRKTVSDLIGKPVAAWVPDVGGAIIKILKESHHQQAWDLQSVNDVYENLFVPKSQHGFHVFEVEAVVFHKVKEPLKKRAA